MTLETILLPDPYPLDRVRSLKSLRLDISNRPPGYLDTLRKKHLADSPQSSWTTTQQHDPLTDFLVRLCVKGSLRLIVGSGSNGIGFAVSPNAFREANPLFDISMSLLTSTLCVWRHLVGSNSLEELNAGKPLWVSEAAASILYHRGHPSKDDIFVIGQVVIDDHRTRGIVPTLPSLWNEIESRVATLWGGRPSTSYVKAVVGPSVPDEWRKRGPKRGRG